MQIAVLGPLELRTDAGDPVELPGGRLRSLLTALALDAGRTVATDRLVDAVWESAAPANVANALQALVSRLRRAGLTVTARPTGYQLTGATVDAAEFARLAAAGRAREALALWRGPGDALPAHLTELRLTALEQVPDLLADLRDALAEYPLRESLVAALMRGLVAAGRPSEALAAYERLRAELADELGVDPSPELVDLHTRILRTELPVPPLTNLRAQVTSFVGRTADLDRVADLVGAYRLTTLLGPGGAGKTRLAVEAARGQVAAMPDGVWFVELAPVTDPAEVTPTILAALGLREQALIAGNRLRSAATDPLGRLVAALADKKLLLVLDNCEHLVATAATVADRLLGECPGLRVLATSREPLGITGEALWPVEPLALPPAGTADAAGYASVRLFADRAAAVRPGFVLDADNLGAVTRICRALDGAPLAIELAAARLRALTPGQIADRLDDRFRLLTGGSRTALPRHQTLRAVVDWSWDLLADPERVLCRRLAIFAGGATLPALEAVTGSGLDTLTALVDKSLVVHDAGRYRMLETIRVYGLAKLDEAGEREAVRLAHAAYHLRLAEDAERRFRGHDQLVWFVRLAEDHDNLQAALRGALTAGEADTAVRLVAALGWYWWMRGHRSEGADLAAEALALPGESPAPARALAYLVGALNLAEGQQDTTRATAWFRAAADLCPGPDAEHPVVRLGPPVLALLDALGSVEALADLRAHYGDPDPWVGAVARLVHTFSAQNLGRRYDDLDRDCVDALAMFERVGDRWGASLMHAAVAERASQRGDHRAAIHGFRRAMALLAELGTREDIPQFQVGLATELSNIGEFAEAWTVLADARRIAERVGLTDCMAVVEYGTGDLARRTGDPVAARAALGRARALVGVIGVGSSQFSAIIFNALGFLDVAEGDLVAARAHHAEALAAALPSIDAPVVGRVLIGIAELSLRTGDPERAATLLGAAMALRGGPDLSLPDLPRIEAETRAALSPEAYARAYARGLAASMDTVADLVP